MIKTCKIIGSILLFVSITTILIVMFIAGKKGMLNIDKKAQVSENGQFMLGVYEEKIAVFQNGKIIEIYDVYVNTLPESDRILLRNGIIIEGKKELKEKIEDFTS